MIEGQRTIFRWPVFSHEKESDMSIKPWTRHALVAVVAVGGIGALALAQPPRGPGGPGGGPPPGLGAGPPGPPPFDPLREALDRDSTVVFL